MQMFIEVDNYDIDVDTLEYGVATVEGDEMGKYFNIEEQPIFSFSSYDDDGELVDIPDHVVKKALDLIEDHYWEWHQDWMY